MTIPTARPDRVSARPGRAPLGPESLTWRYFGDPRAVLVAQRAAVLQVMHPPIAAGLKQHSDVFANPIGRLIRSARPILGVVYDEDHARTAAWVRAQHTRVRGRTDAGARYHALEPHVFYWAHATFFEAQIAAQELFGDPIDERGRRQLYAESVTWYARYGLSMRPVPQDYDAFREYWQRTLDDVLEPTGLARAAVRGAARIPAPHPILRGPAWSLLGPVAGRVGPWLARATIPPVIRPRLGVVWTAGDERSFEALRMTVRRAGPVLAAGPVRRVLGVPPLAS